MFDAVEGSEVQDAGMKLTAMVVLVGFQIEVRTPLGFQLCHPSHTFGKELRYIYQCPETLQ